MAQTLHRSKESLERRRTKNREHMRKPEQALRTFKHKLHRKFNLSIEGYEEKFREQSGLCAICLRPETLIIYGKVARLAVDHCHLTGKNRGLLCFKCNTTLGKFGDDILKFQAAIDYLKKYGAN